MDKLRELNEERFKVLDMFPYYQRQLEYRTQQKELSIASGDFREAERMRVKVMAVVRTMRIANGKIDRLDEQINELRKG